MHAEVYALAPFDRPRGRSYLLADRDVDAQSWWSCHVVSLSRLAVEEWERLRHWQREFDQIYFAMSRAGLPRWMFHELQKSGMHYTDGPLHPPEVQEALRRGEVVMIAHDDESEDGHDGVDQETD